MAEHVDGPGDANVGELYHFTCNVGEKVARVFRGHFDMDNPDNDVLYTDIENEHPRGGMENQQELKITPYSTDEYSARLWDLTAPTRQQIRAQLAADMGIEVKQGEEPTAQQVLQQNHGGVSESQPINAPPTNPMDMPYKNTQQVLTEQMPAQQVFNEYDVRCEVLINLYRSAIDDLVSYCMNEKLDKDTISVLAEQKLISIERTEGNYGIRGTDPETD